ncbi:MAG: hypothetical protein AAGK10_21640, partial [Cyanobacteria bacterium J06555_3]
SHRLLRAQSGALPVSAARTCSPPPRRLANLRFVRDDEGGAYAPDRPSDGTGRIRVCASQTTEPALTVGNNSGYWLYCLLL